MVSVVTASSRSALKICARDLSITINCRRLFLSLRFFLAAVSNFISKIDPILTENLIGHRGALENTNQEPASDRPTKGHHSSWDAPPVPKQLP